MCLSAALYTAKHTSTHTPGLESGHQTHSICNLLLHRETLEWLMGLPLFLRTCVCVCPGYIEGDLQMQHKGWRSALCCGQLLFFLTEIDAKVYTMHPSRVHHIRVNADLQTQYHRVQNSICIFLDLPKCGICSTHGSFPPPHPQKNAIINIIVPEIRRALLVWFFNHVMKSLVNKEAEFLCRCWRLKVWQKSWTVSSFLTARLN